MAITPSEAITAAFRATETELARGVKTSDYDEWLRSVLEHVRMAGVAYTRVAEARPVADPLLVKTLEHDAYMATLRVAVAALLTLGNFPVLRHISEPCPGEKLT